MQPVSAPRVLSAAAVVGRLRAVVCAPACAVDDADRDCAATQLARLAKAGVPGADPSEWHGLAPVSTSDPLCDSDDLVTLTPSTLQALNDCPLRWLAERHGGTNTRELPSAVGSVLHALFAEPGRSESQLLAELDRVWGHLPFGAQWYSANELARHRAMIQAFVQWRAQSRSELTEVGVEVDIDGALEDGSGQARKIRLRGRADRLERDPAGRLVIVDIKTGKTPVSKDDAQQHAQLAMYQLAVAEGLVRAGDEPGVPGWSMSAKAGPLASPNANRIHSHRPRATNGATSSGSWPRRQPVPSSSLGATTGAPTARCGRAVRPTSEGRRHDPNRGTGTLQSS